MKLTEDDGQRALRDHLTEKALLARQKHGQVTGGELVKSWLEDSSVVRYPTTIEFCDAGLAPGLFACPERLGEVATDGFKLRVHSRFEAHPDLPLVVAYHIPSINYGDIVTADDAECFGAALLGLEQEQYYQCLCSCADLVSI